MAKTNPFGKLKEGALHKMLGIKQGQKMAPGTLIKAAKSKSPLERRRAQFAINAKKFHHKKAGTKKKGSIESGPGVMLKKKASKKMKGIMCMKCKGGHKTSKHNMKKKGSRKIKKLIASPITSVPNAINAMPKVPNAMKGSSKKKKGSKKKSK